MKNILITSNRLEIIEGIISIANDLDQKGLSDEASLLDKIAYEMTNQSEDLSEERKDLLKNKSGLEGSELRSLIHSVQRMRSINDLDSVKIKNVIDVLIKNDVWQIPTLTLYQNISKKLYKNSDYLEFLNLLPKQKKME